MVTQQEVPLLVPGVQLGRYELVKPLAVGGMAELFLARATGIEGFEKLVVLKRILPQLATNEDFVRMFLDEARLAAMLHHPNIAQVYDIGFAGTSHFFTMEFVQGKDLREVMRAARLSGGLPLEHALAIVLGVAAGLHYAHERLGPDGRPLGVVHRDVSPANVLVTYDGGIKLVDFGVAKARSRQTETRAGTLKGKISYMSPEQCRGEPVDRRSDVFALGILLYELTTGTRLFKGDNEFRLLQQIATEDAPLPSSRVMSYPSELEKIVVRSLRRDPDARFLAAEDLQVELEKFATKSGLVVSQVALRRYMKQLFPDAMQVSLARGGTSAGAARAALLLANASTGTTGAGEARPTTITMEADEPDQVPGRPAAELDEAAAALRTPTPLLLVSMPAASEQAMPVLPPGIAQGTGNTPVVRVAVPEAFRLPGPPDPSRAGPSSIQASVDVLEEVIREASRPSGASSRSAITPTVAPRSAIGRSRQPWLVALATAAVVSGVVTWRMSRAPSDRPGANAAGAAVASPIAPVRPERAATTHSGDSAELPTPELKVQAAPNEPPPVASGAGLPPRAVATPPAAPASRTAAAPSATTKATTHRPPEPPKPSAAKKPPAGGWDPDSPFLPGGE